MNIGSFFLLCFVFCFVLFVFCFFLCRLSALTSVIYIDNTSYPIMKMLPQLFFFQVGKKCVGVPSMFPAGRVFQGWRGGISPPL